MPNFDIESIVRLLPDKQAAAQALAAIDKLRKGLERVKAASVDNTVARGFKRYVDGLKQAQQEADKLAKKVEAARDAAGGVGDIGDRLSVISRVSGVQGLGGAGEIAETLEALTLFKQGLKELPSQLGEITRTLGGGSLVGGIGVIGAAAAFTLVMADLQRRFEEGRRAAQETLDVETRLQLLRQGGTTEDVEQAREAAEKRQLEALAAIETAEREIARIRASVSEEEFTRLKLRANLGIADPNAELLRQATEQINKNIPIADAATRELINLNNIMEDSGVQARTAADAEKELADAREKSANAAAQALLTAELEAQRLSVSQLRERVQAMTAERVALNKFIQEGKFTGDALKQAEERFRILGETVSVFASAIPAAQSRENAQAFVQGIKDIGKTLLDTNKEINAINDRYFEEKAALEQKAADALVSIAEKAAEAAEDALRDLEQQRDDITRDLGRGDRDAQRQAAIDELNLRIDAQREEARAYRAHVRDLERIRTQAQDRELELEANRDFRSLFFSRRETSRALSEAGKAFRDERKERKIAYGEQRADLAAQIQQEREQRLQQYADQLEDAQIQYNRQLEQADIQQKREEAKANAQAAKELALLNSKHAKELAARGAAIGQELKLVTEGSQRILDIRRAFLIAEAALVAQGGLGGLLGSILQRRQSGGFLGAGQPSSVNEGTNQREGFDGSLLPDGKGLFIPFKSGQVDSRGRGGRSVVLNQNISISGAGLNEKRIAALVEQRTEQLLRRTFL